MNDNATKAFDNRNLWQLARISLRRGSRPLHLHMNVGGKSIVYCYIRKNASSAFKQLCFDASSRRDHAANPGAKNPIRFLEAYHEAKFPGDFRRADHVILVYRDPIERIVSLYRNKFVARSGYRGIHASFQRITGLSPDLATFDDFVCHYLTSTSEKLDAHVIPQYRHLLPIRYTDAIPLDRLCRCMSGIIGEELTYRYFCERRNATADFTQFDIPDGMDASYNIPSADLHCRFVESKMMPASHSFLNEKNVHLLETIYAKDYALIKQLSANEHLTA